MQLCYSWLFIHAENVLGGCPDLEPEPAGLRSFIPLEQPDRMIDLNILKYDQQKMTAFASWDSSMHDSVYLNRVTQNNEKIYLVIKVSTQSYFKKKIIRYSMANYCLFLVMIYHKTHDFAFILNQKAPFIVLFSSFIPKWFTVAIYCVLIPCLFFILFPDFFTFHSFIHQVVLRLCSPAVMDLILRKRICVRIYKKQGLKESLMKKFIRQSVS